GVRVRYYSLLATRSLQLRRLEGVAACDRAAAQAGHEPALALLGRAMGEAVGHHVALRTPLQRVVADRRRRAHGGFDVALFDEGRFALAAQGLVLFTGPDAGETVGLQLDPHLDLIGVGPTAGGALRLLRLGQDSKLVLHVMTDLVGDHVSLCE